nr:PREDICTED: major facilitator superfamily domain-containing protein 4 [Opisthocomus hoazin]
MSPAHLCVKHAEGSYLRQTLGSAGRAVRPRIQPAALGWERREGVSPAETQDPKGQVSFWTPSCWRFLSKRVVGAPGRSSPQRERKPFAARGPESTVTRALAQSLFALFASSLAISLVFAIIPLCHNVVVLAVVMAVAGLAMGCIDTISNMQLVKIYQKDSAIFLQALHFFVGFGALLSPLIADPFLSDTNCILSNSTANASSNLPHIRKSLVPHHPGNLSHYDLPMKGMVVTRVSYAFWIMALINPAEKDEGSSAAQRPRAAGGHDDLFSCCQSKNFRGASYTYFAVHITGALVLFMTDGIVGEYSGFVYSYAVEEPLSVVHKVAGSLPSLFWGSITLGRLISIPVSHRMKPATMVFINVVGILITFLLLLIFSYSVVFLFVGTASLGLFLSSTFPSMLAYTEDILQYKGCATTVLVTGAGVGEMVLQLLVGSIIHDQGSYSFLVCGMIFGGLAFTFYAFLLFFHRMYPKPSAATDDASPDKAAVTGDTGQYQR